MNHLPVEVISSIIQHVDEQNDLLTCTLVSRYFYTATIPFLWRFFAEDEGIKKDDEDRPAKLIDCLMQQPPHPMTTHLRELELFSDWSDTQLIRLMQLTPYLEDVYIKNGETITDTSFLQLPQYWCHIKAIRGCHLTITQESMDAIAQHCPQLRTLHLSYCSQLSPTTFVPFIEAGCLLKEVTLHTGMGSEPWNHQTMLDLAQFPLTLFRFCGTPEITHDLLTTFTYAWPHLTHLYLESIDEVGDDRSLIPFLQAHPKLTHLSLEDSLMTDATLDAIATYLPAMVRLDLNRNKSISGRGVGRLVRDCLHIEGVAIKGCSIKEYDIPGVYMEDDPDDDGIVDRHWAYLGQPEIDSIQQIGPQGICYEDNDDDDDGDDEDKAWLRLWERSFINLRLYGSGVA